MQKQSWEALTQSRSSSVAERVRVDVKFQFYIWPYIFQETDHAVTTQMRHKINQKFQNIFYCYFGFCSFSALANLLDAKFYPETVWNQNGYCNGFPACLTDCCYLTSIQPWRLYQGDPQLVKSKLKAKSDSPFMLCHEMVEENWKNMKWTEPGWRNEKVKTSNSRRSITVKYSDRLDA